jgi:hypothetical protein
MRAIRTSRGVLRRWLALWLEDRRRARAATHAGPAIPNAPANLNAADEGIDIGLTWQDTSNNELGFRLYRKVDAGAYGLYQTFGANVTSYQDSAVVVMHQYSYYVTAYNAVGESGPSNVAFLTFGA